MKRLFLSAIIALFCFQLFAQRVHRTFKDTRVINTHSVETLPKRKLDVRISHRFGDIAGDLGGWSTFYGLENATDVLIGADYGVTDNLMVGFYRSKGAGPLTQLLNGVVKYRLLHQKESGTPISLAVVAITSLSTSQKSDDPDVLTSFPSFSHRFAHSFQLILARKFSNRFSFQIIPGYTHRNLVPSFDENGIPSLGFATRIQLTKVLGFIADLTLPFSDFRKNNGGYYAPLGLGFEIDTGGHVFQINFTNATGIMETDYIPHTRSNWSEGEFRLGFTISRLFNL